ncbi:hypothetical protein MBAV_001916 [Candidatus Magnetobacterium bavaricum]|uniref:Uncharacterized protein n=1 Tax=Candidatus Magnetobacterium bavaricum TaxID=29290 RepID=A0A0F3GVK9_9BACT|nr:hypothetical protein MBAV_001916 [Candidatus Magnetobacterium bavaricum]
MSTLPLRSIVLWRMLMSWAHVSGTYRGTLRRPCMSSSMEIMVASASGVLEASFFVSGGGCFIARSNDK